MAQLIISKPCSADATKTMSVPGDKSISHRALMFGAIARGTTEVRNVNLGADVLTTVAALQQLGVDVRRIAGSVFSVDGVTDFRDPSDTIDCGNSGSTMRMLAGLLANRVTAVLDGDESLRRRPMERVASPLREMGAHIQTGRNGLPPLRLQRSSGHLRAQTIDMTHASAQVKTALLLAGLRADGQTTVIEPLTTRDHSERMLKAMGANIEVARRAVLVRPSSLRSLPVLEVPGDFSAAFFFIAAAAASPGAHVRIKDVGVNPTRTAALDVARAMGVDVRLQDERTVCGEPVAEIEIRGGPTLRGVGVPPDIVPNLIDEIPALCALASVAQGNFTVRGASELRVKESDRISTTAALLRAYGIAVDVFPDGLTVRGGSEMRPPQAISTSGDHRIGMSGAVLAVAANSPLVIQDADCIATSFPGFEESWRSAFCAPNL
jgi:3-phosphoshikimate 1-carboxyvinyltransferase